MVVATAEQKQRTTGVLWQGRELAPPVLQKEK
jgi:hypothetical protein